MQLSKLPFVDSSIVSTLPDDCARFIIDSRQVQSGDCFIAIKGDNFDGHDFIDEACKKGASCVIANKKITSSIPQIIVDDTLKALAVVAKYHRMQFDLPVIALTGSCGKTSVKDMIASILPSPSFATKGNFNNHIGVPLSLLSLNSHHRYAVFELGANHIGEIAANVDLVKPKVALVNNIAPAHLEGFGSIEGVFKAKTEIFAALDKNDTAVINLDDKRLFNFASDYKGKMLTYSLDKKADVVARDIVLDDKGVTQFTLHIHDKTAPVLLKVPGCHTIANALAAASCCVAVGLDLDTVVCGLEAFRGVKGRMQFCQGVSGSIIIDDSYNANLYSVYAALDVLTNYKGQHVCVLGELAEVGEALDEHYALIGKKASQLGVEKLLVVGDKNRIIGDYFSGHFQHFHEQITLINTLKPQLTTDTVVLVKGSRSSQMENVVQHLIN